MASQASASSADGGPGTVPAPRRLGGLLSGDQVTRRIGFVFALLPAVALAFVLITLLVKALPAIKFNGLSFFTSSVWNVGSYNSTLTNAGGVQHLSGQQFGVLPDVVGTLVTSAIALIIAVPVSLGAALFIVERLPRRLANLVGVFLELLAGVPSVIVGLWGALTFGPFIAHDIAPFIARNMPDVPPFSYFAGATGNGLGELVSGLILAVMVIPIVAATSRDLIRQVPILPREGAIALGMSDSQTARRVTLPWVGAGIVGAIVLGLGRALGETMAVAMTCGFALGAIPGNIYGAMTTISATIVNQIDQAFSDASGFELRTLAEVAVVLMIITLAANIAARLLVRKVSGTALPVGRGL
ncbi:MAG TPA: phosphate ABC transporter permease subunit PstC [Streptosporangiaceae bacterium]|nr:phosphate ABC transporter permease subunit PstC [Streptosporangiaceae bacterium]